MEEQSKIVVFRKFNTAIEANILKTKLDANDIPCFLTEENLANLYPGQQFIPFQVRLHLFEKDIEQANLILNEQNFTSEDETSIACPRCRSTRVERDFPRKLSEGFLSSLNIIFFGIFFPQKKINRCLDCDLEF